MRDGGDWGDSHGSGGGKGLQIRRRGNAGDGRRRFWGRSRGRIEGGTLWERLFNQSVIHQTQCCGDEGRFPGRHSLYVFHQRLGKALGELFVEEHNFHIQDFFMAGGSSSVKGRTNVDTMRSPCGEGGKEFLHYVGSGELGSDILQCVLRDLLNTELFGMSALEAVCPWRTPTVVAKEYIERGEHRSDVCASASSTGPLP